MSLTAQTIRQQFLDFFKGKSHSIVPSAPIVIKNDPTLLFTNAGMNQFKEYFLGNSIAPNNRVADTQKCLRVSGKHNDLEEVGVDTYHHTMFEMLGNWSFGDYFKKEAIAWSWELLTEVYQLDKDKIYVTVFEGDESEGLPFDQEAYDEWMKWIPEDRILKGNKKDNFWEMGDIGPCGPCSEIHLDCRPIEERQALSGATLVNEDHPQVIEIWNNVFMEFNRQKDGSLTPLPAKHVDTGMGFERLVRVIQEKESNYDTDLFVPLIETTAQLVKKEYTNGDDGLSVAFRVIADHIRAISFTIADGQLPASTGAGYVIRRILRRAVRYYYSYMDYQQPLLYRLVPQLAQQFKDVFPELISQETFVTKVIKEEEEAFLKTLEKGIKRFDEYLSTKDDAQQAIEGRFVFELYDTYGFPLDLTELMAKEKGYQVDHEGFRLSMKEQKDRSRAATALDTGDWVVVNNVNQPSFVGYTEDSIATIVHKYRSAKVKGKEQYQIVLEKTPFYPEGGGQVGDKGGLNFGEEQVAVFNTKKENEQIIHFINQLPSDLNTEVIASINVAKRSRASRNHSATHLVHAAMRQVLGKHVQQKGSLVNDEVLRFDIAHFSKISDEELKEIVLIVNQKIQENIPVVVKEMTKDEAVEMGAMALFGEKYGTLVRTVIIDPAYSIELCGGTHVGMTGAIGSFVITSESAVAAGVRRIEALTGEAAITYLLQQQHTTKQLCEQLKSKSPLTALQKLQDEKAALLKQVQALEQKALASMSVDIAKGVESINGIAFVGQQVSVDSMDALKSLAQEVKINIKNEKAFVLLVSVANNKPMVAISMTDRTTSEELNAGKIIKSVVAPLIKGGGGGSPVLASAGGKDIEQLSEVLIRVKALL